MNPDCIAGKHTACSGDGWDATDAPIPCPCDCHRPVLFPGDPGRARVLAIEPDPMFHSLPAEHALPWNQIARADVAHRPA